MNKIEKLLEEFCPQGVEFKDLSEVTAWDKKFNGIDRDKQKKVISYPYVLAKYFKNIALKTGNVRLLSTGDYIGWTTEELAGQNLCDGEIVAIPWGGRANVKYYKGKFVTADNRIATSLDENVLVNKFLYYWMLANNRLIESFYRGSGIKHPNMKKVLEMKIPIPPLTIQKEIVKILDNFTQLEAELKVELEAELEARKKQYEYYRGQLLMVNDKGLMVDGTKVEFRALGEVGQLVGGSGLPKTDFTDSGTSCIHYGQIYTHYGVHSDKTISFVSLGSAKKLKKVNQGDLIITKTSEDIDGVCKTVAWLGNDEIVTGGHTAILKHKQNSKYLSYYINGAEEFQIQKRKYTTGVKIKDVSLKNLAKIKIPIPPLAKQQEIVAILDKFDALVNDISTGLPAEIVARKKQYEYYRNQLLNFKPLEAQDAN